MMSVIRFHMKQTNRYKHIFFNQSISGTCTFNPVKGTTELTTVSRIKHACIQQPTDNRFENSQGVSSVCLRLTVATQQRSPSLSLVAFCRVDAACFLWWVELNSRPCVAFLGFERRMINDFIIVLLVWSDRLKCEKMW